MPNRMVPTVRSKIVDDFFAARRVAVTGAAGTVGRELVRQLLRLGVTEVRALDNDENGLFELDCEHRGERRLSARHCDVASPARTRCAFERVDYLFHAAALKHVSICEHTPAASIDVNVLGVTNVVESALDSGVKRIVFTSSDKAVHPTNVMGASKLLGERLALAANKRNGETIICCTRFGNVAGSRGSVVPVFRDQILKGAAVTLTSSFMTRFVMSNAAAVALVIETMVHAQGGELFVTKMPALRISDLATVMIRLLAPSAGRRPNDVPIDLIGMRPGEKRYEELVSDEEVARTFAVGNYLIVLPLGRSVNDEVLSAYERLGRSERVTKPYNSELSVAMTEPEIAVFLRDNDLLPGAFEWPAHRMVAA